jgi:P27 family predicted phage terminase small subunit
MPTKAVAAPTMQVGHKGGRKHWTKREVEARGDAAEQLKRAKPIELKPPDWLSRDARVVWKRKLGEIAGLNTTEPLLDVLDSESLAIYCDVTVKYREISNQRKLEVDDHKAMQSYARILAVYADKLGFTPSARARLVKRRADGANEDPFGKKFD